MSKSFRENLTGQRFGRLTVLEFAPNDKDAAYWLCKCICGKEIVIAGYRLRLGHTTSCGCSRVKHGESKTRLYRIWKGIKQRCYNPNGPRFKDYGGKNIVMCDDWRDNFESFRDWAISNGYDDNLSIDRIDADGNYEPNNCRWADTKTQNRNKTHHIYVTYNGEKAMLVDVAQEIGINYSTLNARYHEGDRGERLFRAVDEKFRRNLK